MTQPLTRTIVRRDGRDGEATTLSTALESASIQGVTPLDANSKAALDTGAAVSARCLKLTALPDEQTAVELRTYYRTWIKLNGAFVALVRANHASFLDWIDAAQ